MTEPETFQFAADFPFPSHADWRRLVDAVLKGAPFERLRSRTYDGLVIEPLATRRADAPPIAAPADAAAWQILSRIDHPDPARANEIALHELENGATGLSLVFAGAVGDHGFGLPANADAIAGALKDVHLDAGVTLDIDLAPFARDLPQHIAALAKASGVDPAAANIRFGYDTLNAIAATGTSPLPWNEIAKVMAHLVGGLAADGFKGPFAAADGRIIHNAAGSEAQELAFALGSAVAYLRAFEAEGIALDAARRMIFFRLAADADQFLTIAKFRALRKLWARVQGACGLEAEAGFVAAETAWRMLTRRDPYTNILRATIATVAAAFGGADAVSVLPFTAACGLPDRFARRIARNTQLILIEESHLAKVADPAAGAGTVEDLTDRLARAAWSIFQEIETAGGVAAALQGGLIQRKVAEVRAKRASSVAHLKDAVTGVSIFPDLKEMPVSGVEPMARAPRARSRQSFEPLTPVRLAAPFEILRDASDKLLDKDGTRPKIFLATVGSPAEFTARATFARNFFEAGGIEAVGSEGAHDTSLETAYRASGAMLACLCATDAVYEKEAAGAARALKAAGAKHVYLAGRPAGLETAWREAGAQSLVFAGCDALATLRSAYDILGIEIFDREDFGIEHRDRVTR